MVPFDDELDHVCAWGRWRIGAAVNEPVLPSSGELPAVDRRPQQRVVQEPTPGNVATARGASRLRLVTDDGRPVRHPPKLVR